jgi:Fe2+ transport system protein B
MNMNHTNMNHMNMNHTNIAQLFARVLQGPPVELDEFEKEISRPVMLLDAEMNADVEDIIVEAIMRRSCNPICVHLRIKEGFQPHTTLTRNQLQELSSLQCEVKARELARFYARIATLQSRIMQEQEAQAQAQAQCQLPQTMIQTQDNPRLQRAYTTQIENMRNKQRENRDHLDRIMRALVLNQDHDPEYRCIHPKLTSAELDALELQVQDILECGCATHELRCIKIQEAAMEHRICDALIEALETML